MNDASIIELYLNRNEQAIRETEQKYGRMCFSLANNMLNNLQDSEECVNDTYLTVWNSIPPEKPKYFSSFLCRITKNFALKKIEYSNAQKRSRNLTMAIDELNDCVSGNNTPEDEIYGKELSDEIGKFLLSQKQRERNIFVKRYWFYESINGIAKEFNLSERNVSLILFRTRQKLKNHLTKEGFNL